MKTIILLITLICGCIVSTYSQMNQKRKRGVTADSLSSFHYDIKPALGYKKMIKPNGFRDDKIVERFLSTDSQWASRTQAKAFVQDSMPCYKPEGVFSIRIIKPDTTTGYTMLIKRY